MAAVGDGFSSCSSVNMRRADHLLPLPIPQPCIGEPTAASRVSPGSSPARSEASGGAAYYGADVEAEPDVSVGRSTQMMLAMAAMGGRGGQYGRRPASSYGSCAAWSAGSLTKHCPASPSPICSPVSSRGGGAVSECDDPEPHGGDDASSFITPSLEEDFMKPSATPRNIRLQTPGHPSLPRRVEGANRLSSRFIHRATPARLIRRARSSRNNRQRACGMDAINEWRLPKVSEENDEEGNQDWQADTVSSRISSGRDWNFESGGAFEGSNHGSDAFNHSDGENCPVAGQRDRRFTSSLPKLKNNFAHAKLVAWKDAQIAKLIEKLKKKEADVDDWQTNKVAKAKQKMRITEMKLEKMRAIAGEKMQKKIQQAQKKADKKKVKEQAAIANQIAGVETALAKMSRTGKLPWSLAFL